MSQQTGMSVCVLVQSDSGAGRLITIVRMELLCGPPGPVSDAVLLMDIKM